MPSSNRLLTPLNASLQLVMSIQPPNLSSSYLRRLGNCWHLKRDDVPNIDSIRGERIASFDVFGSLVFARCVIEPSTLAGKSGESVVHVHVDFVASELFDNELPTPNSDLAEISAMLFAALGDREVINSESNAGFRIGVAQIAIGSILGPIVGMDFDDAYLTRGTFALGIEEADELSFTLRFNEEDEAAFFSISIDGNGVTTFSENLFCDSATRLSNVFDRFVLAKQHQVKQATGGADVSAQQS